MSDVTDAMIENGRCISCGARCSTGEYHEDCPLVDGRLKGRLQLLMDAWMPAVGITIVASDAQYANRDEIFRLARLGAAVEESQVLLEAQRMIGALIDDIHSHPDIEAAPVLELIRRLLK